MPRVGISTACFYPEDTLTSLKTVTSLGVPLTEVFLNSFTELSKDNLIRLKQEADDKGTRIISFHPFTSLFENLFFFSGYPYRITDGLEIYKRFFDAANFLGAKYFVFHGERSVPTYSRSLLPDEALLEVYFQLTRLAKSCGIVFTQENVSPHRSASPEFLKFLSDSLGDEIAFTFDLKQAFRAGQDIYRFLDVIQDKLVHVHINDFGPRECCLPFCGEVDFHQLKAYLDSIGYSGAYIIEVYRTNFKDSDELYASYRKTDELFSN